MNTLKLALGIVLLVAFPAWGQQIDRLQGLVQHEFRQLSEDLGGALSYRPQTPTTPLGVTGFDIGVAVTAAKIKNLDVLERATSDRASSTVLVPTLRAHKGLPWGFDIGVAVAKVPDSNVTFIGGEWRYAIVEGNIAMPAVGLRGSFTRLGGVDQLRLNTYGLDVSISKGFAIATPYAGVGIVRVESDPRGVAGLTSESFTLNKGFAGVGLNFGLVNFNLEADRTGPVNGYSAKVSLRF
ncbi:MAG: hypothetical protein ACKVQU_14315 [Burkholderiales bacterium]